jgi:cytochrome b6-f complex iron-sulfur subunit
MAVYCLGGCSSSKNENDPQPTPLPNGELVLDLTVAPFNVLRNNGGFIVLQEQKIVVARTNQGNYLAVTRICSHEGKERVSFNPTQNIFFCDAHGAQFDVNGRGLNSFGKSGLRTYRTELNATGDRLTIRNS